MRSWRCDERGTMSGLDTLGLTGHERFRSIAARSRHLCGDNRKTFSTASAAILKRCATPRSVLGSAADITRGIEHPRWNLACPGRLDFRGLRDGNSKCEKPRTRVRRHRRKKAGRATASATASAQEKRSEDAATATKHVELPVVVAPQAQVEPSKRSASPLMFWPALPIAMMRTWLGPRAKSRNCL